MSPVAFLYHWWHNQVIKPCTNRTIHEALCDKLLSYQNMVQIFYVISDINYAEVPELSQVFSTDNRLVELV